MQLIPELNIKGKVDMEILMMVVMEDTIRLPRLPPVSLEVDTGVVDDTMVVQIHQYSTKYTKVHRNKQHWTNKNALVEEELRWMDGSDTEGSGLLVGVVELVEVAVEEWEVENPVGPVSQVVLPHKNNRP